MDGLESFLLRSHDGAFDSLPGFPILLPGVEWSIGSQCKGWITRDGLQRMNYAGWMA